MFLLKDKSITICLLAKNCFSNLKKNISEIENMCKLFSKAYIIVVENDSTDGTRELIEQWKKLSLYTITILKPEKNINNLSRIHKMVYLRNLYLDYCKQNIPKCDYAVVIDGDLYSFKSSKVIRQIYSAPKDWSGLLSYGQYFIKFCGIVIKLRYYDLFAYVPYGCSESKFSENQLFSNFKFLYKKLKKSNYVLCESGFGGIGIYRYDAFIKAKYDTEDNPNHKSEGYLCEHIKFHRQISLYGNLYICKKLTPLYEEVKSIRILKFILINNIRNIIC